jgi:hypothetical protein
MAVSALTVLAGLACVLLRRTAKRAAAKRAAMKQELRLSQRLDAVGLLAAGIAHEINTPTQFVGDTIRFLREACAGVLPCTTSWRAALDEANVAPELLERVRAAEEAVDRPSRERSQSWRLTTSRTAGAAVPNPSARPETLRRLATETKAVQDDRVLRVPRRCRRPPGRRQHDRGQGRPRRLLRGRQGLAVRHAAHDRLPGQPWPRQAGSRDPYWDDRGDRNASH